MLNNTNENFRKTEQTLQQVMQGLNQVIVEQVKQRTCQRLAPALRCYLDRITRVKRKPEDKEPADSMPLPGVKTRRVHEGLEGDEQGGFLFQAEDNAPGNKKLKLKRKIKIVQSLVDKYNHMSSKCRTKVQPVRSYLYHHLELLESMLKRCEQKQPAEKPKDASNEKLERHVKVKTPEFDASNILSNMKLPSTVNSPNQAQLDKLKSRNTKSSYAHFDVDKFIEENVAKAEQQTRHLHNDLHPAKKRNMQIGNQKENEAGVSKWDGTEKYKRLVETANNLKRKRQTEERLGELFGANRKRSLKNENYHTIKSKNKEIQDLSNVNFEAPMILSLDN